MSCWRRLSNLAKKKLTAMTPEETFKRMFLSQESSDEGTPESETKSDEPHKAGSAPAEALPKPETSTPAQNPAQPAQTPMPHAEGTPPKRAAVDALRASAPKGMKFYLTAELDDALARRAYRDRSRNRSAHVRAALEAYLKEDLEAIRESRG